MGFSEYQLWHGDCLEEMDRIEDGSVDAIICDPPYGVTSCAFDMPITFEPLWKHYRRIIKPHGAIVLFGSEPFSSLLRVSNLDWYKYDWVWIKNRGGSFALAKHRPMKEHETISVFSQSKENYYPIMQDRSGGGSSRVKYKLNGSTDSDSYGNLKPKFINQPEELRFPSSWQKFNIEVGLHPHQKPVALLEYLSRTYTGEGELILDNCFGSCSAGEAALRTGRRFIGIEKDAGYFEIGVARMERVAAELRGELNHLPMFAETT